MKFILTVVVCLFVTGAVQAQSGPLLQKVQVQGAERVDPQTVLSYLTVKIGEPMDDVALSDSTRALYATGLFSDVNLAMSGGTLTVNVTENSLINQVAFEGNDKVKDENLSGEIQSQPRSVLSRTVVQRDVDRITELYRRQGRFAASVTPQIIKLEQNRVNLVFAIDEGDVSKIEGIKFVGNENFTDSQLRSVVSSKEDAWYRFLSTSDRYDPDRVAFDEDLLRRFYLRNGYVDFRILNSLTQLTEDKDAFYVTYTVDEGEQYKVGSVNLDTSALVNGVPQNLDKAVLIKSGEVYNADYVEDTVTDMTNRIALANNNFIAVKPDITKNAESKTVDLVFKTETTPKVFVERINVKGNLRTEDKVIRREFEMAEGDPFSRPNLAKSEQNIRDLDFFDQVNVDVQPGSAPDKAVVDVEVAEKSTGELSIAGGFSTEDGPIGDFGIRERNFLGKGQDLKFSTTLSGKRAEFDLSLTEPKFMDRDLSAGIDAFHTRRDLQSESSYDQQRTGAGLRFGYPLSRNWAQSVGYRIEQNKIDNVDAAASRFIRDQEGSRITSAINQRLTYDTRDSKVSPANGMLGWWDAEGAGLGGDARYVSSRLGATKYWPINRSKSVVFSVLGEGAAIVGMGEDVRINERYYLGGNTLRGFRYGGLGPRDTTTADALGGNYYTRGTAELSFPLGLPEEYGIKGYAFTDVGTLWGLDETGAGIADENSVRVGSGVGIGWQSPMGPIRLDFSSAVRREDFDETESFRFSFGTSL